MRISLQGHPLACVSRPGLGSGHEFKSPSSSVVWGWGGLRCLSALPPCAFLHYAPSRPHRKRKEISSRNRAWRRPVAARRTCPPAPVSASAPPTAPGADWKWSRYPRRPVRSVASRPAATNNRPSTTARPSRVLRLPPPPRDRASSWRPVRQPAGRPAGRPEGRPADGRCTGTGIGHPHERARK